MNSYNWLLYLESMSLVRGRETTLVQDQTGSSLLEMFQQRNLC